MFTDKQLLRLSTIDWIAPALYVWVRYLTIDVHYNDLTALQRKTLHLIADMSLNDQKQYVIVDDLLIKAPTNTENYTIVNGEWVKRQLLNLNK